LYLCTALAAWAIRKRLQKKLKSAREAYISDFLEAAIKENPKGFWSYIKQLKNVDPGISDFKGDGKIVSDGRTIPLPSRLSVLNRNQLSTHSLL